MRKAVLIMGLAFSLITMVQSYLVGLGGEMFDDQVLSQGGAMGRLMAILILVGAAFVLAKPAISVAIFAAAGVMGFYVAITTGFYDLFLWGIVSLILTLLSFFARKEAEEHTDDIPTSRRRRRKKGEKASAGTETITEAGGETL